MASWWLEDKNINLLSRHNNHKAKDTSFEFLLGMPSSFTITTAQYSQSLTQYTAKYIHLWSGGASTKLYRQPSTNALQLIGFMEESR